MGKLQDIKRKLTEIYKKYDTYLASIIKFILALVVFVQINIRMGYMDRLNSIWIIMVFALVCSFLPLNALVFMSCLIIIGHLYALSIPAAVIGGGIILIVLLLYLGIAPQQSLVLILTPLALVFHIPCLIPLAFGLTAGPLAAVGMAFGTIVFYVLRVVNSSAGSISGGEGETLAVFGEMKTLLDSIAKEKEMILMLIAMLAVIVVVYVIRKMAIKYAWSIAIGTGTVMFLFIKVIGGAILGVLSIELIAGTFVSGVLAAILQVFIFDLDYERIRKVQFEDDEFYYYVKAVPKRKKGRDINGEY